MLTNPMRAPHASLDVFNAIFKVIPWPALMLGQDGAVIVTSEEADAPASQLPAAAPPGSLRERAGHYVAALRGEPPWLTPQEVDTTRSLPSGEMVHERLVVRRTDWGACLIIIDQTELRELQVADVQTARLAALGFMVAGVCHEISNPLTSLHSVVQILRSEPPPGPELLQKGLSNIAGSVRKILDISRRLVRFSRVGDEPRARFPVDLAIEEALQVMRQDGLLDRIDVQWRCDPAALVVGNTGQLSEVFLNLLLNAVQAMDGSGRLGIDTATARGAVEVVVSDTGPGISEAVRSRMFEPFFTTRSAAHGTGLGLAISREIVLEHGGGLNADRTPRGASFRVELPRARP